MTEPKTAGIAPAQKGALAVLQFTPPYAAITAITEMDKAKEISDKVYSAAREVATYHTPTGDQAARHANLSGALAYFLEALVANTPSGPERSTAISRAREAEMWASAGLALEGR